MDNQIERTAQLTSEEKRAKLAQLLKQKASQTQTEHPLTYGQKALWFLHQAAPHSPAYHTAFAVRIVSPLDCAALQRALQTLLLRHPALRTRITQPGDELKQTVDGYQTVSFTQVDATQWSEDQVAREVAAAYQQPFDLAQGPLFRVHLFVQSVAQADAQRHVLLLTFHHIICDAWSIWILIEELGKLYAAECSGIPHNLPAPERQFADFAHWQNRMLTGPAGEEHWLYWRKQLADSGASLTLPSDCPYPAQPSYRGASYPFLLPAALVQAVRQMAQANGTTFFSTLLAAFQVFLYRYSGQEEILVGTPTAGRGQPEFEQVVGYFVNPIVVRGQLAADVTFQALLQQVRTSVLEGMAHQDFPFPLLVERLQLARDPSRSPLFQAFFVLQKPQQSTGLGADLLAGDANTPVTLGGLQVEPFMLAQMEGQFDLHLEITEGATACHAVLKYNPDLFEASTIARMTGHFQTLLTGVVADPTQPISTYPLLPADERQQLLVDWNATQRHYPSDICLHQLFEQQVARTPDAIAVILDSDTVTSLTYQALNERANQLAHHLRDLGVGPDVLVGVALERSLEMVIALYAILKAGGAYVPLDPTYPPDRLDFMLSDAQPTVLLTHSDLLPSLPKTDAHLICLDKFTPSSLQPLSPSSPHLVTPDNLAYMIYTSGSTGKPKGALNAHRGIVNRLLWMQEVYQLTDADRVLQKTPFSFDVSVWEFFWPLLAGATLVVARPEGHKDSTYLIDLIQRQGITTLHFVPSMLQLFLEEPTVTQCTSLRQVICSGEALPFDLQERFFARLNARLDNLYGPTEAAVDVTWWQCQRESQRPIVPIGRPVANTQMYVLDRHLQPVPIGVAAELYIGGVQVGCGYHNRSALTQERFIDDPFALATLGNRRPKLYKTGDLARFLPDGAIEYLGRIDNQIKLRGFRIELGEIEAVLSQHPEVRECAVIVDGASNDEKRLVAYLVPVRQSAAQSPDLASFRLFLQQRLPDYMTPAHFILLEAMPLSPNGKLDRGALPRPSQSAPKPERVVILPQSDIEKRIAEIWRTILQVERVGIHDNFFELGGHSLLLGRVRSKLSELFARPLSMVQLFQYPTIHALATYLRGTITPEHTPHLTSRGSELARPDLAKTSSAIAVIGMACRFPGAANVESFWHNLCNGVESITFFSADELIAAGIDPQLVAQPNYVPAKGALDAIEFFDADFFGFNPREAELLDVQQRVFLECTWSALEDAGYDPATSDLVFGVYAGTGMNTYLLQHILPNRQVVETAGGYQVMIANDKDFLTTRVAYKLNLKGPAMAIQTACSTSLVAIHTACQSLLNGECDVALAGGVSINLPNRSGYLYQDGMILSPDGHCRAFAAEAAGTVGGNGAGVVVLKRLSAALQDGDTIHAVVLGSALNNDGALKTGYTAPGVEGQSAVISKALANAGVTAESISYIETHGTATPLGDPIEIAALSAAFAANRQQGAGQTNRCALGSVKTNIGHLDAAAGVAGFIKTVLALKHRQLPPSLHYARPNPQIDFAATPFFVNTELCDWPVTDTARRAGVSSFGIGGTNAHVILEEAPVLATLATNRPSQLLLLSTHTTERLAVATLNLAEHLIRHPAPNLGDIAYTLACGRRHFATRRFVVAATAAEAVTRLQEHEPAISNSVPAARPTIAFLLPGQGAQHINMAHQLYQHEPLFRAQLDACAEALQPHVGLDIRQVLYPTLAQQEWASEQINQTALTQPILFAVEYALAKLWQAWGVQPDVMIGHSLGEYVCATLAGVFSLADALKLVALRGRLMQELPAGAMLAVHLSAAETTLWLNAGLTLAAINTPNLCVVAGPLSAVARLEATLTAHNIPCARLHTSHAFHSAMMEPIIEPFVLQVQQMTLHAPQIPFISNITGKLITAQEAQDGRYWANHLRQPVRFADGLQTLWQEESPLLLEVGPGNTLTNLALRHPDRPAGQVALASLPTVKATQPDLAHLLQTTGKLWLAGVAINWQHFYAEQQPRRISLPTYPFARQRYWIDLPAVQSHTTGAAPSESRAPLEQWFYLPSWKRKPVATASVVPMAQRWLLLVDDVGVGAEMSRQLRQKECAVVTVCKGEHFAQIDTTTFVINPTSRTDYLTLLAQLPLPPDQIVHLWAVDNAKTSASRLDDSFYSLLWLAQAIAEVGWENQGSLTVLSSEMQQVCGEANLCAEKATLLGPLQVMRKEFPGLRSRAIDLLIPSTADAQRHLVAHVLKELSMATEDALVAYRGGQRWVPHFEPITLPQTAPVTQLRPQGVYLITGGLGGIGLTLAGYLAQKVNAHLVLISRTPFPDREVWPEWLQGHPSTDGTSQKIVQLQAIEGHCASLTICCADVADRQALASVIEAVKRQHGLIHGVIHAAGVAGGGMIQAKSGKDAQAVLAPKVLGALHLAELLAAEPLDFLLFCSSVSAVLGEFGQVDYCAANAFLDAFALQRSLQGLPTISINWDTWQEVGMAANANLPTELRSQWARRLRLGIRPAEGAEIFARILASGLAQLLVSTGDFATRLSENRQPLVDMLAAQPPFTGNHHQRPALTTAYVAPDNAIEQQLATIWQELLGIAGIGRQDNFFDLGGHSLLATQVLARISDAFGVRVTLPIFFENATIALLGDQILLAQMEAVDEATLAELLDAVIQAG